MSDGRKVLDFPPVLRALAAGQFGHAAPPPTADPEGFSPEALEALTRDMDFTGDALVNAAADTFDSMGEFLSAFAVQVDSANLTHEDIADQLRRLAAIARKAALNLRRI